MKLDKAKEVAEKVAEIHTAYEQLKRFNNTKEFCEIRIKGENGNEQEYTFFIGYKKDKLAIGVIRDCIVNILGDKIEKLSDEIWAI